MSKFVVVNKAPETVSKNEFVIEQPTFLEQIAANSRKAPKYKQTALNHMREVLSSIAEKFDHDMNVYKIPLYKYEGVPFKDDNDLSAIFVRMLRAEYPAIFDKYLEHQVKSRPLNTKLVHYVGAFHTTGPLFKAGLDHIEEKDVADYLSDKPKKVVGKPALTKEEADARKEGSN